MSIFESGFAEFKDFQDNNPSCRLTAVKLRDSRHSDESRNPLFSKNYGFLRKQE
jgi:hypothetical protein